MSARKPRGQNLMLLSLTMLFLALMVTVTIGLGFRVRQRHELQNLADAAAFSNAVMNARAFNNSALINRLEVSYYVSMAADESLISWTSYARAMPIAAYNAAGQARGGCANLRARRDLGRFQAKVNEFISREFTQKQGVWDTADLAAAKEALLIQGTIYNLRMELSPGTTAASPDSVKSRLDDAIRSQQLTRQIIAASRLTDVRVVDSGGGGGASTGAEISRREEDCDFGATGNNALTGAAPPYAGLCLRRTWNENMMHAAMGSRGNPFVTGRGILPPKVKAGVEDAASATDVEVDFSNVRGSGYWFSGENHGEVPSVTEAWGDDHGRVSVSAGGCSGSSRILAHVTSTHEDDPNDDHYWFPSRGGVEANEQRHTMGNCQPLCPAVWVRTIGFQPKPDPLDAYGQPKSVVVLERDLTMKKFPWELHFEFPFSATGNARKWDARGEELHTRTGAGLNISRMTAIATGMTYYHRFQHWDEFPNLLNPFWRATLVAADIDEQSKQDIPTVLSGGDHRWQGDGYDALMRAGYKGLH